MRSICLASLPCIAFGSPECAVSGPNGPLFITPDCVDPQYSLPVIDSKDDTSLSGQLHRVKGHFENTTVKFEIHLPESGRWAGRFFQLVYPTQTEIPLSETLAFGAENDAATVQATGVTGYRAEAATAKFARKFMAAYYNTSSTIFGYIYGGSGGSLQTVGAVENSERVWDGSVPIVQAIPISIPLNYGTRALGALAIRGYANEVRDAVAPGGSGDPFAVISEGASLGLMEATKWGHPLSGWENYTFASSTLNLKLLADIVTSIDPDYHDDFWNLEGYLGTEKSDLGDIYRDALLDTTVSIRNTARDTHGNLTGILLGNLCAGRKMGLEFTILKANATLAIMGGELNHETGWFTLNSANNQTLLANITVGDRLQVSNKRILAISGYHRHQISYRGYSGFSQFLDREGKPKYPQRSIEIPSTIARGASGGGDHTGKFYGKMIVVDTLVDMEAMPMHADWYKQQVIRATGDGFNSTYRLWYNEHADHSLVDVTGTAANRLVSVPGLYFQALKDLSAWVERGIPAPSSTKYDIVNGQIRLPSDASDRGGIQPVVNLTVQGRSKKQVAVGSRVDFEAFVEAPGRIANVSKIEWDFPGQGDFGSVQYPNASSVQVSGSYTYEQPGEYIVALRATTRRDMDHEWSDVSNLGRVRVVVI